MEKGQALGYMLLACKRLGYSKEEARKVYEEMYQVFDLMSEDEAEELGFAWYDNLPDGEEKRKPRKRNATPAMLTKFPDGFKMQIVKELEEARHLIRKGVRRKSRW